MLVYFRMMIKGPKKPSLYFSKYEKQHHHQRTETRITGSPPAKVTSLVSGLAVLKKRDK